jgi:ribosomal protein S18 acetylase RimI-like enzyme
MNQIKVTDISDVYFQKAWELYENSFPVDERRTIKTQGKIMKMKNYNFEIILNYGVFIGFMFWWKFNNLRYIEHFATSHKYRCKGYGESILRGFVERDNKPILLEVELPEGEIEQRRINFYQRIGFKLNNHLYVQPSLSIQTSSVKLLLMSYPDYLSEKDVSLFVKECHPIIYLESDYKVSV